MSTTHNTIISLTDVTFSWHQARPVLDIPQLEVVRGEKVFVRGVSGSGKTTLLGLLSGVLVPEKGTVNVLGTDLCHLSPAERDRFRANHIGFIFQMFNLIPYLSLIENVTLPLGFSTRRHGTSGRTAEEEARRLLTHLGLTGIDVGHCPVTDLSIGQQQRVAAARALIGQPDIVIADEPTSALDTDTRASFIRLLFSECEQAGSTVLFVSHDPALEPLFDRTIVLESINQAAPCQGGNP